MLAAILRQLVRAAATTPDYAESVYQNHKVTGKALNQDELERLISSIAQAAQSIHIVADALDEFDTRQRKLFLAALSRISHIDGVRILMTCRPHVEDVAGIFPSSQELEITAHSEDLAVCMYRELEAGGAYDIIDNAFARRIVDVLIERSSGM
jgi:hypothetical protein